MTGVRNSAETTTTLTVVVFSDQATVRRSIITSAGVDQVAQPKRVRHLDTDDPRVVFEALGNGDAQLAIIDGEAPRSGGIGLARELKDEIRSCPPIIVIVRRQLDHWLARWSRADKVMSFPLDPEALQDAVDAVLRPQARP